MTGYKTAQEDFWAGTFGNKYTDRNYDKKWLASNINLFSKILGKTKNVHSVIEFGANIGLNLLAIKAILPDIELSAIEINKNAVLELENTVEGVNVYHQSIFDFKPKNKYDFVLTKGVLIHINPDKLHNVYEIMYQTSNKYICIAEYYNPSPVSINYRGHKDKLFKRDFTGEILDKFTDIILVDYGFVYHRDNNFPQDDINWFLLEKLK